MLRTCALIASIAFLLAPGCATPAHSEPRSTVHLPAEGALGPYSGSVRSGGLCFVSGTIGKPGDSFASEARAAIDAVEKELARSELTLGDVLTATVFLTDMTNYGELNAIYAERFPQPYPARTCIAVKELPAGAHVEIQVIARRGKE